MAVIAAKALAGWLALAQTRRPGRRACLAAVAGGAALALYGWALVLVGALVLLGVIDPGGEVDEYALRWHVLFWDLWFGVWGVALAVAGRRALSRGSAAVKPEASGVDPGLDR